MVQVHLLTILMEVTEIVGISLLRWVVATADFFYLIFQMKYIVEYKVNQLTHLGLSEAMEVFNIFLHFCLLMLLSSSLFNF